MRSIWRMFHIHLRRMCVLILGGVFYISLLGLVIYSVVLVLCYLIDLLSGLSIQYRKEGIEISYYYCDTAYLSLKFYLHALLSVTYIFLYLPGELTLF